LVAMLTLVFINSSRSMENIFDMEVSGTCDQPIEKDTEINNVSKKRKRIFEDIGNNY